MRVVSAELNTAMEELGISNVVVAQHCGVTEKVVREWRGRGVAVGETPKKTIPFSSVLALPDALRAKMAGLVKDIEARDRQQAREAKAAGRR